MQIYNVVANSPCLSLKYHRRNTMIKKIIATIIVAALMVACGKKDESLINIGVILPLTGNLAFMGSPEKNGFELALDDYKSQNPNHRNIQLIFEDSRSNAQGAVSAAHKLIQIDKPVAIFASNTGPNLALAPITEEKKILQIAFCMEPDIQKKHDLVFRLYESAAQEGKAILDYLNKNSEKLRKIGFLYIDQPNFVKTVEGIIIPGLKTGIAVALEKYKLDEQSFRQTLLRLQDQNIDCAVILGYGSEYRIIFSQMKELGMLGKMQIIGGWGFLYPQLSKDLLEGVRVAGPIVAMSEDKVSRKFREAFYNKFNEEPNFDAAFAYSAMQIVLNAIDRSPKLDSSELSRAIENQELNTPIGNIAIRTGSYC